MLIATNAPVRNASEVLWALWAAIQLEVPLSAEAAAHVAAMEDNFVALTALHADQLGLFAGGSLDVSGWEVQISASDSLHGPSWLLAYEASKRNWLSGAKATVASDSFFNALDKADVHFYDIDPEYAPFTGAAGPLGGSAVPDEYL